MCGAGGGCGACACGLAAAGAVAVGVVGVGGDAAGAGKAGEAVAAVVLQVDAMACGCAAFFADDADDAPCRVVLVTVQAAGWKGGINRYRQPHLSIPIGFISLQGFTSDFWSISMQNSN